MNEWILAYLLGMMISAVGIYAYINNDPTALRTSHLLLVCFSVLLWPLLWLVVISVCTFGECNDKSF